MKDRENERIELLNQDERVTKTLIDLSATGAAFMHPIEVKKGARLSVKIKDFTLDASVVYCQEITMGKYRIGLQFSNVPAAVQSSLKTMVGDFSRGVPLTCEILEKSD